jgi:hypothetical protein
MSALEPIDVLARRVNESSKVVDKARRRSKSGNPFQFVFCWDASRTEQFLGRREEFSSVMLWCEPRKMKKRGVTNSKLSKNDTDIALRRPLGPPRARPI